MLMALLGVAGIVLGGAFVMYGMATHTGGLIGLGFITLALAMIVGLYVPAVRRGSPTRVVADHDHDSGTTH
ncbi:MAG TPA: hypothetical protein VMP10_04985 [Chloroflexota bacterium]|nr:hypothetical protein [Chloroflexota bacterium]